MRMILVAFGIVARGVGFPAMLLLGAMTGLSFIVIS